MLDYDKVKASETPIMKQNYGRQHKRKLIQHNKHSGLHKNYN